MAHHERTAALLGGDTLIGRELRDVLADSEIRLQLVAEAAEDEIRLTEQGGEPAVMWSPKQADWTEAGVVFLASPADAASAADAGPPVIDLTGALEDRPDARLRAPMLEPGGEDYSGALHVIAHPAAIALGLVLTALQRAHGVRRAVSNVFDPASERGQPAIEELQQQTINLLSFKSLPKRIYDAQAAFNLLARFGEEAPAPLQAVEERIERHLATLLAPADVPLPSLRVLQAPIFHGCAISLWVELEDDAGAGAIEETLSSAPFDLRGPEHEAPSPVGMAGQSGIGIGAIDPDRSFASAYWIWIVADNLRLAAENALLVAREL